MKFDRANFEESFPFDQLPEWTCPTCNKGNLVLNGSFITTESIESKRNREDEGCELEQLNGKFQGELICENKRCGEKINISGKFSVEHEHSVDDGTPLKNTFYPEYFYPYLKLFEVPEDFPFELEEPLEKVFKLFWIDKSVQMP